MQRPRPPACSEEGLPNIGDMDTERVAAIAKGLAHPSRVRIVAQFTEGRPLMAHEIVDGCPDLAQSTVSEHLRVLREADILFATKDGPRTWYCMRRSVLRAFAMAVDELTADLVPLLRGGAQFG